MQRLLCRAATCSARSVPASSSRKIKVCTPLLCFSSHSTSCRCTTPEHLALHLVVETSFAQDCPPICHSAFAQEGSLGEEAHPKGRIILGHRMLSVCVCQLHLLQVVAGVRQPLQEGWQALEAQPRQAVTARGQQPSLVPAIIDKQGISVWASSVECNQTGHVITDGSTLHAQGQLCFSSSAVQAAHCQLYKLRCL